MSEKTTREQAQSALAAWVEELAKAADKSTQEPATEYVGSTQEMARHARVVLAAELVNDAKRLVQLTTYFIEDGTKRQYLSFEQALSTLCVAEVAGKLGDITIELWNQAQGAVEDEEDEDEDGEEEA